MQVAIAKEDSLVLGKAVECSAGPYTFYASTISFRGRKLGYASASYRPMQFSPNYWVYFSCTITHQDPAWDGECVEWKTLNTHTGKVKALGLPGFDSFWSVPTFSWPYVAYVEVDEPSASENKRGVYCVILDYQKNSIIQRIKQLVPEDVFATDFPRIFGPPMITKKSGRDSFAFSFYDAGTKKPLCELFAPR